MTQDKFNEQILRLSEVFGAKHYTIPRLRVILNSVKQFDGSVFERAVNFLIATKRVCPLALEIIEACDRIIAEDKQRAIEDAPTVGLFDQLQDAARRTAADKEFVQLCLKTVDANLSGKLVGKEFRLACDSIDSLADQINPKGKRRDLVKQNGQWIFADVRA